MFSIVTVKVMDEIWRVPMTTWTMPAAVVLATLGLAACGSTTEERAATGGLGGAAAGAVVGGPVGAVVGAGVGAAGGVVVDEQAKESGETTTP